MNEYKIYFVQLTKLLRSVLPILMIGFALQACSGTKEVQKPEKPQKEPQKKEVTGWKSNYPDWFEPESRAYSDSSSLQSYGAALGSSTREAVNGAELRARILLEQYVDRMLEDARQELADNGNDTFSNAKTLLMLRNATAGIGKKAERANYTTQEEGTARRAFVKMKVSRQIVESHLGEVLQPIEKDWQALKQTEAWQSSW